MLFRFSEVGIKDQATIDAFRELARILLPISDEDLKGLIDTNIANIATNVTNIATNVTDITDVERVTATWTPSWGAAGFSTDPTGDLRYQIIGGTTKGIVIITADSGAARTGTSDNANMSITGIPSAIRPSDTVLSTVFAAANGGFANLGIAEVSAAGVMTFQVVKSDGVEFVSRTATDWETSGAKGFVAGCSFMYPLTADA